MLGKIKGILGSIRFYVVTFGWLADYFAKLADEGFDGVVLLNQLALWLGTVAAIGTVDSFAKKFKSS